MAAPHRVLLGIGVSAGTAHGAIALVTPAPTMDPNEAETTDVEVATQTVTDALDTVARLLLERAERAPKRLKKSSMPPQKWQRIAGLQRRSSRN